jgi:hypothetical protein
MLSAMLFRWHDGTLTVGWTTLVAVIVIWVVLRSLIGQTVRKRETWFGNAFAEARARQSAARRASKTN